MNEFQLNVSRVQAQELALEVINSSETVTFLLRAAQESVHSLTRLPGALDKLNRKLKESGYAVVPVEYVEKPARASKSLSWSDGAKYSERPQQRVAVPRKPRLETEDPDEVEKPKGKKVYPEQSVNGPILKALIAEHGLCNDTLASSYSMNDDELEWLAAEQWENFTPRELYELVSDITTVCTKKKKSKVEDNRGDRSERLGSRLVQFIKVFGLSIGDLQTSIKATSGEVRLIKAERWSQLSTSRLDDLITAVVQFGLKPKPTPQEFRIGTIMVDLLLLIEAFVVTKQLMLSAGINETQQQWILDRDTTNFAGRELFECCEKLKAKLLESLEG